MGKKLWENFKKSTLALQELTHKNGMKKKSTISQNSWNLNWNARKTRKKEKSLQIVLNIRKSIKTSTFLELKRKINEKKRENNNKKSLRSVLRR